MTAIMDLSFPGQRTAAATSCIPHDSVYMRGPRAGKSNTWLQIFQNDSKICEAGSQTDSSSMKFANPVIYYFLSDHALNPSDTDRLSQL